MQTSKELDKKVQNRKSESTDKKKERFNARISSSLKELLYKAAILQDKSLSEFVIDASRTAAEDVIRRNEKIIESDKDKEVFFEALTNPPKPNKKLKDAVKKYKKENK